MKVLVVSQRYFPDYVRINDICETLVERGHDVTVLAGRPFDDKGQVPKAYKYFRKSKETINGVKVVRSQEIGRRESMKMRFISYLSFIVAGSIRALTLSKDFDVVLVNQLSPVSMGIPAMAYKKVHKTKILLYSLDLWPASVTAGGISEESWIYKVVYSVSRRVYKSADKIMITSKMFKSYFDDVLKIEVGEENYLPQYAESLFENMEDKRVEDEKNFVFAGNIGDFQKVETIIEAADLLKDREEIKFHFVGDGSNLQNCKDIVASKKLTNVIFHGRRPVEDMPEFYSMADAMLVTLGDNKIINYTLPGKVQSYMAAGKPVIGAINGETPMIIEAADCGYCCPAEDADALAENIRRFIDQDMYERFSANALAYYKKHFDKNTFINRLEKELTGLEE